MTKRKPISAKMRFEVFKRDKFTCQYCGRMAPDVVLEIDHINPVSNGGENDLLNLVTSCMECNRGKGARQLSDDSVVKKQQAMTLELAEKNEQLEMMLRWKEELEHFSDKEVDGIIQMVRRRFYNAMGLTDSAKTHLIHLIDKYSFEKVYNATVIAFERYYDMDCEEHDRLHYATIAWEKIPGILRNQENPQNEADRQAYYLRKILINRLTYVDAHYALELIKRGLERFPFDDIKDICKRCRNWTRFKEEMEDLTA